ncbi:MAG: formate dehydrogenase subunit gamma [Acidobacteria bacterium]|nr:formate dehydrogenase subunit gamma [Acidobacteriota bacterium]
MASRDLVRFSYYERLVHWLVGLSFVYLLFSGLAFSHPKLFWVLNLLGGPQTARWLHPWLGLVFVAGMVLMFFSFVKDMGITQKDREWLRALPHYARLEKDKVPPSGKYNAGQKGFFWAMVVLTILYLLTGLPLWCPQIFGVGLVPVARFLHYLVTLPAALLLLLHVYLGIVLFPGTARSMLYGTVTRAWAKMHHPLWAREKAGD